MVPGLKQMYVDLGYATDIDDFENSLASFESRGFWNEFDQHEFVGVDSTLSGGKAWEWDDTTWSDNGYVYIPISCHLTTCKLHIAMHYCESSALDMASYAGYNEFAANNDIIVVYPESVCWNSDGDIDSLLWLTKDGLFPRAIEAIICRLTSEESTNTCKTGANGLVSVGLSILAMTTIISA